MKHIKLLAFAVLVITATNCKEFENISPVLTVSQDTLIFNGNETKKFILSSVPTTITTYQITSYPSWVTLSYTSGQISYDTDSIAVTTNYNENVFGLRSGEIVITSSIGSVNIQLLAKNNNITIPISTDQLIYPVVNSGSNPLNYSTSISNNYISIANPSGTIAAGEQVNLQIDVNRPILETGSYQSQILLNINSKIDTINVTINHLVENKILLQENVVDAEYSKVRDRIVYVSSNPRKISQFNINDNNIESIDLDFTPTCVSVSTDGTKAVVGHDARITYIDLVSNSIIKTIDVPCYVFDVVIGTNGWAYATPRDGQSVRLKCINLNTEEVSDHTGNSIYMGAKIKLHPSGNYIYLADNNLSPGDIRKINIQAGTGVYMYDSPYHGEYPLGQDLWFAEDGVRIFTKPRTVLKTSTTQSQDLTYNGITTLPLTGFGYNKIQWLHHSAQLNNLYIISTSGDYNSPNLPCFYVYNATNLDFKSRVELERYYATNSELGYNEAEPFYIFSNTSGNKVFVLTKAAENDSTNTWAVQPFEIE